jgi:hypothetical protein
MALIGICAGATGDPAEPNPQWPIRDDGCHPRSPARLVVM